MKLRKLFVLAALIPMVLTGCNNKSKKLKSISLTDANGQTAEIVLNAGGTSEVKFTYDPAELKPSFSWVSSDEKVATVTPKEGGATLNGKLAGEAKRLR